MVSFPTYVNDVHFLLVWLGGGSFRLGVWVLCGTIGKELLCRMLCIVFSSCWYACWFGRSEIGGDGEGL